MKRMLVTLLGLMLCLCLTACGSETEKTAQKARDLLEAGDWAGARLLLDGDAAYQELEALDREIAVKEREFLLGNWISLNGRQGYTFREDGTVTVSQFYSGGHTYREDLRYRYEDGQVEVRGIRAPVREKNGILFLGEINDPFAMVREGDYGIATEPIEITMENFHTYFTLEELVPSPGLDEKGNICSVWLYHVISLREEYLDKFVAGDVCFEVRTRGDGLYATQWEEGTLRYTMQKREEVPDSAVTHQCCLDDRREMDSGDLFSEIYRGVVATVTCGMVSDYGDAVIAEDPQVIGAQGILKMVIE